MWMMCSDLVHYDADWSLDSSILIRDFDNILDIVQLGMLLVLAPCPYTQRNAKYHSKQWHAVNYLVSYSPHFTCGTDTNDMVVCSFYSMHQWVTNPSNIWYPWLMRLYQKWIYRSTNLYTQLACRKFKVVLEGCFRCPDSHDLSAYHHLYDLGRHI